MEAKQTIQYDSADAESLAQASEMLGETVKHTCLLFRLGATRSGAWNREVFFRFQELLEEACALDDNPHHTPGETQLVVTLAGCTSAALGRIWPWGEAKSRIVQECQRRVRECRASESAVQDYACALVKNHDAGEAFVSQSAQLGQSLKALALGWFVLNDTSQALASLQSAVHHLAASRRVAVRLDISVPPCQAHWERQSRALLHALSQ